MSDVFPTIYSLKLAEAPAGSIVLLPRIDGHLLGLVTDEVVEKDCRSLVILNLKEPNYPSVIFAQNWNEMCLCYEAPCRFELSNKESDIDVSGRWWRACGVIVSTTNEILVRSFPASRGGVFRHVNVQTGAVFSGDLPNFVATFGVWSFWLRDPLRANSMKILDFDIHKLCSQV